jgi:hypothetical protein
MPNPKCVGRALFGNHGHDQPCNGSEGHFQQVKTPQPAVPVERARPQLFGELPRACRERSHASGNVQAKRKQVSGEVILVRRD